MDKKMSSLMDSVSGKRDDRLKLPTKNEIMKDSLYNLSNIDDEQVIQTSKKKYKNWWDFFVIS